MILSSSEGRTIAIKVGGLAKCGYWTWNCSGTLLRASGPRIFERIQSGTKVLANIKGMVSYLLAGNPALVIHEVEPALQYVDGVVDIPFDDGQQVEPFIPKETAWKEGPRRRVREQRRRLRHCDIAPCHCLRCAFPEI